MKTETKTLVPKRRFPEFRDELGWKKSPLSGLIETVTPPKKLQTSEYLNQGLYPIIDQSQNYIAGWTNDKEAVIDDKLPLIIFGDHTCILKFVKEPFAQGADGIKIFYGSSEIDTNFLFQNLQSNPLKMEEYKRHFSILKEKTVFYPLKETGEQQKIADCLSSIDEVITAQGKKVEALKDHKKGLMQKLFPTHGKTTPAFRFPEFCNAPEWKEEIFGKVFTRITSKNNENNKNSLTISAQDGLVSQLDYFNKKISAADLTGYYLLHKGDFAYNKSYSQGYPMGAIKRLKFYDKGVVSTLYICFRANDGYCEAFFDYYFDFGMINNQISKIAQEGARNHGLLNIGVQDFFEKIIVKFPKIKEQQKIADCLSSVDDLITAETQKFNALKDHKKGLMQQLFPTSHEVAE